MNRHYAPCTLKHELHEKPTSDENRCDRCKDPRWDQKYSAKRCQNDATAAAPALGKETDDSAATNRTDGIDDGDHRLRADAKTALFFQEGGIKILGTVRHVVEGRHENGGVK